MDELINIKEEFKILNEWLSRIVAYLEARNPDIEMINGPKATNETIEVQESVLMDLIQVTPMAKTEKALMVVKKGYQKWIAFSLMDIQNWQLGVILDIKLTDKAEKWFHEKSWEPFKPQKGGN